TGRDPDFHRRELWEAIEAGDFPEYELGFQLIPEEELRRVRQQRIVASSENPL
ncbi:catalase, partial [Pseudomonas aeruginosa]|uniref:catalase n=1 Tax=Pseudomonas aeruginosa TaxID=287 RepID=UPI003D1878D5